MDVLADVLSATRIDGTIFSHRRFPAPWGVSFEPAARASFHVVIDGRMWLRSDALEQPLALEQGDIVLLPHGAGHSLASDLLARLRPLSEIIAGPPAPDPDQASAPSATPPSPPPSDPQAPGTTLMCGSYRFDRDAVHPLLSLLPPVIHIPADDGHVATPLESVYGLLSEEYARGGPGSQTVITRLVDVLFIYIIRSWATAQTNGAASWIEALRDGQIGRALAAMHRQPRRDWSVNQLANEVGMSRSSFVRRFSRLVGEPPLSYLTRWRMDVAAQLLRETELPMAQIADRIGYRSEYAFNRAFQRTRGTPPGRYRERVRVDEAAA